MDGLVCISERDLDPQFHVECQPSQRPIALFTSSSWRWCHKVLVLFFLPPSLPGAHSFLLTFPRSDSVKRKCNLRRWLHRCLLALKRHESSAQYMTLLQSNPLMQQRTDFHVMVDREGLFQEDDRSACAENFCLSVCTRLLLNPWPFSLAGPRKRWLSASSLRKKNLGRKNHSRIPVLSLSYRNVT